MLGGLGLSLLAAPADAGEAHYRLSIPAKPYADALIDLGVQANVSIVGTSACRGSGGMGLAGVYSLEDALRQLLSGAPCSYRIVDPRTVRIGPAPTPAHEAPRPPTFVAEVLVTATKRPASLERLAAGVSAISHEQIEVTGAADVGQTTGQLAGVLTTNLGPGRDKLIIRGLSDGAFTGRTRSTVSTYLDDAPINYNAPDPDLRLVDVERVEVVRGPQGALYGSGSISGIYRIVTHKPDLERTAGGAAVLGALTDGGSSSREVEGYWNAPVIPGKVGLRLVAYHEVLGGYLDDTNLRLSNVDRTEREGARLALRLQISDAWQVDLSATGQHLRTNDTQYTTPEMASPRSNRVRETHKNDFAQGGATVRGELGWARLSGSLALVHHTFSSQYDASAALDDFSAADSDLGLYAEKARVSLLVGDLVLRSAEPGRLSWLAGIYAADNLEKTPSALFIRTAAGLVTNTYSEQRRDRTRELAIYGEGSYEFLPGWTASAGARLFESRVRTLADIVAAPPGMSRFFERGRTFTGVLPKISLQREFVTGDLIYALVSEGYRPGGFNSGGYLQIRSSRVFFAADRLRNFEVGAKFRLLDRRLGVRTAAYYDDWSNIQTDQYRPSGLSYTANVGDAWVGGLEAEVAYDFDLGLSLQGNVLLSTSEMTRINPDFPVRNSSSPPIPILDELPGVPKVSGGVVALYQRPLGGELTLRLAGEAGYVGRSEVSFDATRPRSMGHYLRAKLSAEIASEHWTAGVFVTNPTNESGDTFAYGNPFSFGDAQQVTPQRPRTVGLRLAAAF
jgi:outer membrane receptor protein involved in Fe transport